MDKHKEQEHLLNQLFREQREADAVGSPSFREVYGKAQQKHGKMKRIKLTLIIAIAVVALASLAILTTDREQANAPIQVAKAGLSFYEDLQANGKFVVNDIQFAFNSTDLKPESQSIIQTIAKMMEEHPEVRLSVEGHTDDRGSENYNQELSARRAAAVRQAIIGEGIAASRLKAAGFGEVKPVTGNDSDAGRAKNRRVEFVSF
ncbi:OmpA family protein [Flavilitoribacter nigricans]|nr:OmpA family protein [Flavilitoribacter nigricans]